MARLTYAVLAAAAAALISGFFVRTSSLPLIASIVLSVLVSVLILYGWSRRIREVEALEGDGAEDHTDIEFVDLEAAEVRKERKRRAPAETVPIEIVDEDEFAPRKRRVARTKPIRPAKKAAAPKKKAAPEKKAAAPKRKPVPHPKRVSVIPGASRYHRPGCRFAHGSNVRQVSEATAREAGYLPCDSCKP